MKNRILTQFFSNYSKNVDNAENIWYWKLSDLIIETIIQKHIDTIYKWDKLTILDAWCWTWRWIKKIILNNKDKKLEFIAFDLFDSMLNKARENLSEFNNVKFIKWNLENIDSIENNFIDFCVSIYSPISFVDSSDSVIREIWKLLKKDAEALIMWHSYHNAIDSKINNYLASDEELTELQDKKLVRWNDSLPPLNTYSIENFIKLWDDNWLKCVGWYWVTIYVKPQIEDWDAKNAKNSSISIKLENDKLFFDKVFDLEMKNNFKKWLINRGINILAYFKK